MRYRCDLPEIAHTISAQLADAADTRRVWWPAYPTLWLPAVRRLDDGISTRQLHADIESFTAELLRDEADPAAVEALNDATATWETASEQAEPAARAAWYAAHTAALATCKPDSLRLLNHLYDRLESRFKTARRRRRSRFRRNNCQTRPANSVLPRLSPETGSPPDILTDPSTLTRRANLTVRPTIERLARTLTLAPGAPSLAVCV